MNRNEATLRLQSIRAKAARVLELLDTSPFTEAAQEEARDLVGSLKEELQAESKRLLPERVQRTMTMFELSVYSPTIEEAWSQTGISRLRVDGTPNRHWHAVMEAVCSKAAEYLR